MKIILFLVSVLAGFVLAIVKNDNPSKQWFDAFFAHDKLIHALGSQVLFLIAFSVFGSEKTAFGAVMIVGLVIEIVQAHPMVGRGFSVGDLVADAVGVIMVLLVRWV